MNEMWDALKRVYERNKDVVAENVRLKQELKRQRMIQEQVVLQMRIGGLTYAREILMRDMAPLDSVMILDEEINRLMEGM